jgi:hypothetical protein
MELENCASSTGDVAGGALGAFSTGTYPSGNPFDNTSFNAGIINLAGQMIRKS